MYLTSFTAITGRPPYRIVHTSTTDVPAAAYGYRRTAYAVGAWAAWYSR